MINNNHNDSLKWVSLPGKLDPGVGQNLHLKSMQWLAALDG